MIETGLLVRDASRPRVQNTFLSWMSNTGERRYGFRMGDREAQHRLRQFAIDTVMIQLWGPELEQVLKQFSNLPVSNDDSIMTWYGDHAKFIARHIRLV